MKRIVKDKIVHHLERNNIIADTQHEFWSGRSYQSNLLEFMEKMTKWADDDKAIDVAFLDFTKAFEKVSHNRLMEKVEAAGITGKVISQLKDWLTNWVQRVVLDGEESGWLEVLSSVVQGSVLGSTLFDIYIDDIDEFIRAMLNKFADDMKAAQIVENEEDQKRFQKDIDHIYEWLGDNVEDGV